MKKGIFISLTILMLTTQFAYAQIPQKVSYQGVITTPSGNPLPDGNYDLTFSIYDVPTGGVPLWTEFHPLVPVGDGMFTVVLGSINQLSIYQVPFDKEYWLGITVDSKPELVPRTPFTSSPYSLNTRTMFDGSVTNSKLASGAVTSGKIAGGQVVMSINNLTDDVALIAGPNITITPGANDLTIAAVGFGNFWRLDGNAGTIPASNFLGTTDNRPLELRVNNIRALRLEPDPNSPNLIGGFYNNKVTPGVFGATICGGGLAGLLNNITDNFCTIGGGAKNQAGDDAGQTDDAVYATVGGGHGNTSGGNYTTIAGGLDNLATDDSSTVGGGEYNEASNYSATVGGGASNQATGNTSTVGGGFFNEASAGYATVSGGRHNTASADYGTVGGGYGNRVTARYGTIGGGGMAKLDDTSSGNLVTDDYGTVGGGANNQAGDEAGETSDAIYATVGGGYHNVARAHYSTVPGGSENIAQGEYSFAAGRNARANHHGCFVWGDAQDFDIASTAVNQFIARAYGGAWFFTDNGTLSLEPHGLSPNIVCGHIDNSLMSGVFGATISGGGGGGLANLVSDQYCTIGGGAGNEAGNKSGGVDDAQYATVSGGKQNVADHPFSNVGGGKENKASGAYSTVGGGESNEASNISATVGGGSSNLASGEKATVGGGVSNKATWEKATVGGGWLNEATAYCATVAGGNENKATMNYAAVGGGEKNSAAGEYATVGGGKNNAASNHYATVPGGRSNEAGGEYSFAAGYRAKASDHGCFVWGDATNNDVTSSSNNQFIVRASGGVWFYSDSLLSAGVHLPVGSSAWDVASDMAMKRNIRQVDGKEILSRLAEIPISRWSYKSQNPEIEHVGPMSQDFYAAFGLGEDERHISTVDTDGVALAAIQGLYEIIKERDARIIELEARVKALEQAALK